MRRIVLRKRRVQSAADAGAIAGAQELLRGNTSSVTAAAKKDTSLNRYTDGSGDVVVTVNNPPASGARVGNSKFVEVIVSRPRPTWFMRAMGISSANVRARAVAGLADSTGCAYALNRDTSNSNNGIFVNGTTSSAFDCGVSVTRISVHWRGVCRTRRKRVIRGPIQTLTGLMRTADPRQ